MLISFPPRPRRACLAILIMTLALSSIGGSRGIKEGLYAVTGASGKTTLIKGDPSNLAAQYGSCTVETFQNDIGDICPQSFLDKLPGVIQERLRHKPRSLGDKFGGKEKGEMGPFFTGPANKTILITGRVIQYDIGDIANKAMGPLDEAICRVQILDADTNTMLAEANLTSRVKSSVRTGPSEMAEGIAKAIEKLFEADGKK